ncbi:DUF4352 domain-containing protein [Salinicoccus sp. Marseille-QA3877]
MSEEERKQQKKRGGCLKWVLIIFGVLILLGACGALLSGGDDATNTTPEESTEESTEEATEEATEETNDSSSSDTADTEEVIEEETETAESSLSIGDSATIDDITFTLDDAYYTDERNQFAEIQPDNVLMLDVTIQNDTDQDYPVGMDIQLYVDGSKAETYPVATLMDGVSAGRSISGQQSFAIMGEPSEIELEFSPFMNFSGEKAIYSVDIQ